MEVDETYIGGEERGLRGGRATGRKSLVAVAVEVHQPRGYGRTRMSIVADAPAACLHPFITANVEPGTTVITGDLTGWPPSTVGSCRCRPMRHRREEYEHAQALGDSVRDEVSCGSR
ncbi:MAG: transposase [Frankiaceae bacterium]